MERLAGCSSGSDTSSGVNPRLTAARSREAVEKGRGSDKECMMVVSDPLKGHLALGSASPGMQRLAFKSSPPPLLLLQFPLKIWLFLEKNSTPYTRLERLAGDVTSIIYSLLRQRHGTALLAVSPSFPPNEMLLFLRPRRCVAPSLGCFQQRRLSCVLRVCVWALADIYTGCWCFLYEAALWE